ncbi:hypothetical protein F7725_016281 [Dissostichus mawsoni]|uniref:PCIF1 WW domain-containing protein n=1 Tax=Dissostichus mawsoni TaxID=36200 RepID=A0A7J5Z5G9_DISMA|nr:hypothetical protein F7725_016281 [Dissostichus mawsoni]
MSERRGGRERRNRNKRTEPQTLRYLNRQGKHRQPRRDPLPVPTCGGRCPLSEEPDSRSECGACRGGDGNLGNGQRKRRNSEEQGAGPNSIKRPKHPRAETLELRPRGQTGPAGHAHNPKPRPRSIQTSCTNAVIREHPPANHLHPHPEIELQRAQLVTKLRQHYHELCHQREGIDPPRESFNRWLLERKVIDKGQDTFLPSDCDPVISPSMFREVMNDIPSGTRLPVWTQSVNASPESRKVVKWNAEDTMSWLRRDHSASKEDYMDRLEHLRKQCGPHLTAVAKDSVEGICSKIYQLSVEYSRRLRSIHLALLPDPPTGQWFPPQQRLVYCFPVRLAPPSPPLPRVELHFENDVACLRFKGEMVKVNRGHFSKLELLYRYSCIDDPRFEKFLTRVWCLLKRYQVLFGSGANEGSGLQGALPVPVFEALMRQFGVSFECFASPLNCYFKQFSSAFPDTDGYFGSRGPFLSFCPVSGSFEANPPFCEELMDAMVTHFEGLLEKSSEPLSFIVFVPEWRDPVTPALTRMEASRFLRHQMTVTAFEHEYRDEMYYRAVHGTAVIFLQNDAGFSKWAPTPERLAELTAAYQPSPSCPPPCSHDDNSNNTNSSSGGSGPVEKVAAVLSLTSTCSICPHTHNAILQPPAALLIGRRSDITSPGAYVRVQVVA